MCALMVLAHMMVLPLLLLPYEPVAHTHMCVLLLHSGPQRRTGQLRFSSGQRADKARVT